MRLRVAVGAALLCAACTRSFTSPSAAAGAFEARPSTLLLSVDEEGTVSLSGGKPPYSLSATAEAGCPMATPDGGSVPGYASIDGGTVLVPGCLTPNFQETLTAQDSAGSQVEIPVIVGTAFQSSSAGAVSAYGCTTIPVALSGGKPPYYLIADGGPFGQCADGGSLELVSLGITSFAYVAPPYADGGTNAYELELMDSVERAKGDGATPSNIVRVNLVVEPPQGAVPAALTASPGAVLLSVDQGGTVQLSGGVPPYGFFSSVDGGCSAPFSDGGSSPLSLENGVLTIPPCLTPNFQQTLTAYDARVSDGGPQLSIPVSVGAAFQSSATGTVFSPSCASFDLTLTGGEEPYFLELQDGGPVPYCDGRGLVPATAGLTTFEFSAPAFVPGGDNTYLLRLLDSVEFAKQDAGLVNLKNVITFTLDVEGPAPQALAANPSTLLLAVGEPGMVTISGGIAPYHLADSDGGGCLSISGTTGLAIAGDSLAVPGCLVPDFVETLTVRDSGPDGGAELSIPVSVGAAFQSSVSGAIESQACNPIPVSLSGGKTPYYVVLVDGGVPQPCGGTPVLTLAESTLTGFSFLAPAYVANHAEFSLLLMDEVEYSKLIDGGFGGGFDSSNAVPITLMVVPSQVEAAEQSRQVAAQGTFALASLFPDLDVSYRFAFDGNSSGATLDSAGDYTAGGNLDTVDHVVVQNLTTGVTYDVWLEVGNPTLSAVGGPLFAGDLNGDQIDDLVLVDDSTGGGARPLSIVLGSTGPLSFSPSVNLDGVDLDNLELADVNGDGLADLLLSPRVSGQSAIADCSFAPLPWCLADGEANPAYGSIACDVADGGCLGAIYGPDGGPQSEVAATSEADGGIVFTSGPATIACAVSPQLSGGNPVDYLCTAGCVPLPGGSSLCVGWTCGPGGCESIQEQAGCTGAPDGGGSCADVVEYQPDGQSLPISGAVSCTQVGSGQLACGPFTCEQDLRGGTTCGARDCEVGSDQNIYCVPNACAVPVGGFDEQCTGSASNPQFCRSCQLPTPSAVGAYLSIPGGGFLPASGFPGIGAGLPAELGNGKLILAGGYVVQGSGDIAAPTFSLESGPLYWLNVNPEAASAVAVAHRSDGTPWAIFQSSMFQGAVGISPQDSLMGITAYLLPFAADGGGNVPVQLTVALDNQSSLFVPLQVVDLSGTGDESAVVLNVPLDGGPAELFVFDPPGGSCDGLLLADGGLLAGGVGDLEIDYPLGDGGVQVARVASAGALGGPPPGSQGATQFIALPAIHGVALGWQGNPSGPFVLAARAGCGMTPVTGTSIGIAALDMPQVNGLASGDFNGDGVPDLAVSTIQDLTVFPGHLGGSFAQGDQYALASPVVDLSASGFADGGGLLAAFEVLSGQPAMRLMALANNVAHNFLPDGGTGGPVSHLAYVSDQPLGATPVGAVLRGSELWVLESANGGALGLTRQLDATQLVPSPPAASTTLLAIPGGALGTGFVGGGPGFSTGLVAVPGSTTAAWVVVEVPGTSSTSLWVDYLEAPADGGSGVVAEAQASPGEMLPSDALVQYTVQPGGELEVLISEGATDPLPGISLRTYGVTGTGTLAQSSLGFLDPIPSDGGFVAICQNNFFASLVEGGGQILLPIQPVASCAHAIQNGCCAQNGGWNLAIYNTSDGGFSQVSRLTHGVESSQAFGSSLADGGLEIISVSVHNPGLFGVLLQPDGTWAGDPAFLSSGQFLVEVPYPSTDGVSRHVISTFSPDNLDVVSR